MKMRLAEQRIVVAALVLVMAASGREAMSQAAPSAAYQQSSQSAAPPSFISPEDVFLQNLRLENSDLSALVGHSEFLSSFQPLFSITDYEVKFNIETLMETLRDSRHESWVLAAYPDPKTSRPLIGAGFNLDVRATEHLQCDPLNPHTFIEPSSAELWQAAGLSSERLQTILEQFDRDLNAWKKKNFRRKIRTHQLSPELTDGEATRLLQISVLQAVHNARAYCREFDQLTAFQQMALSQLVFQMGVNLEEFIQFLGAINDQSYRDPALPGSNLEKEAEHWKSVQSTLIQSDWARRYTGRAVTVIAMFDPNYDDDPTRAERQVRAVIHPLVVHHRKKPQAGSARAGN